MRKKEIEFSFLLKNLFKNKLKLFLIVLIPLVAGSYYNYHKKPIYKISLNLTKKKTISLLSNFSIKNKIYSHHTYYTYKISEGKKNFKKKFYKNFKNKSLLVSIFKENSYLKRQVKNLSKNEKKIMFNNLASSVVFSGSQLSIVSYNVKESKKILIELLLKVFESTKKNKFMKISNLDQKKVKIFFEHQGINYFFNLDEFKFTYTELDSKKKKNYLFVILISFILGFFYLLYLSYADEIFS